MALYSGSQVCPISAQAKAIYAILSPANNQAAVKEIGWIHHTAPGSTSSCGLGRSPNVPVFADSFPLYAEDEARPQESLTQHGVDFAVRPTIPSPFLRRASFAAGTLGVGVFFTFPRGILLTPAGTSICIWSSAGALNQTIFINTTVEE